MPTCTDDDCKRKCPSCVEAPAASAKPAPEPTGRRWTDGRRWSADDGEVHNLVSMVEGELTCTGCGIGLILA